MLLSSLDLVVFREFDGTVDVASLATVLVAARTLA